MFALPELQSRFRDAVFDPAVEAELVACLTEPATEGRRRIAAYRRSILGNLVSALEATYPVLARIVGQPFFRELARAYVRERPSTSGDLNEYGVDFADFVAAWPHGRELAYLPDVARLEWLVQRVYYDADAVPDLAALAICPPERYGELRFILVPAFARLDSAWPLADIWRVNAEGYAGDMAVDFSRHDRLAVLRRDGRVVVERLDGGQAALLDALAAGECLDAATNAALAVDADFNLGAVLGRLVADGLLERVQLEETP